ncbi:ecdysoneless-like protein [Thalictrum thalictroides]|uniref:Ecdysoneless-like protein n=1 Tax=Thalictrum thalictroides TaxID=46969 RepID=A0A7J6XCA4_THATH|nr:ecdysoneless-like protein [Thalictrum thalictroides]
MNARAETQPSSSSSSIFSRTNSRIPEDTVFYAIFPDISLEQSSKTLNPNTSLQSLHLQILEIISPYLSDYIWQHEPFTLSLSSNPNCICTSSNSTQISHLHGKTRYGDNLEDEWFVVFLLFEISRKIPQLSIRVWDTDGEFLLIEAAFSLPKWINPENSLNRVFIRGGELHIVPKNRFPLNPNLVDSLRFLVSASEESRASDSVQLALKNRILGFPERAGSNMHKVKVRVPVSVAQVLKHEPCLISLAVEGFYDRDIDSMKYAARMEKFLSRGSGEELVQVSVRMSRAMYAQLVQQMFQAPKFYPMPPRTDSSIYLEAELGMKIACGFEMMYQRRHCEGSDAKGSSWDAFRKSLESSGYFKDLLPGSKEYRRRMENALEYYKNSSLFSRTSEMINAPVRRIDEILSLPHSADDFKCVNVPPSDDDAWLYNGEDELNSALLERQKEMENYELSQKKGQKSREQENTDQSSSAGLNDFDLGNIAKTMQAFVHKVSSFEGAEVPENRDSEAVSLDVDSFFKDMESVMKQIGGEENFDDADDDDEGSDSDMDFDDSEDGSDPAEDEYRKDTFMESYSDTLNEELKATTLEKSFIRADGQSSKKDSEGTSNVKENMDEDFTPVDVDINLVKSLLDSFSSQQGLPGPASNLLGLMGLQLPKDANKDK